jgi:hypothetical protein
MQAKTAATTTVRATNVAYAAEHRTERPPYKGRRGTVVIGSESCTSGHKHVA